MGFGGHVKQMIDRLKENEAMNKARWDRQQKISNAALNASKKSHQNNLIDSKELSEYEKATIRLEMSRQRRKENIKKLIILGILLLVLIAYICFLSTG